MSPRVKRRHPTTGTPRPGRADWAGPMGRAVVGALVAVAVAAVASSPAAAAWSPAIRLVGNGSFLSGPPGAVTLDSHGVPWVVYSNAGGLVIAAISTNGHLTDATTVPTTRSADSALLSSTPGGPGILAWSYSPNAALGDLSPQTGVAAASWKAGHPTGRRVIVAPPAVNTGLAGALVNARGTAEVLWTGDTAGGSPAVFATRLLGGRLAGAQELGPRTTGAGIAQAGLSASPGGGFRASWQDGHLDPSAPGAVGPTPPIETAVAIGGGVFGAALAVPWPAPASSGFVPTEQLVSDVRGDQAVVWDQTGAGGMVTVFASSRRSGRPFSPVQQIAQATWGNLIDQQLAAGIGPTGQVTIMATQPTQYPAVASATGEIIAVSGAAGTPLGGSRLIASNAIIGRPGPLLVVTPHGRAIAIWAATQHSGIGAIEAATSTNGGAFSIPQIISAPAPAAPNCQLPELLTAAGSGEALAGWKCSASGGSGPEVNELARFR